MLEWSPMFIGHYAVGLIGKKFAPRTSLGALIAAPILLDLLWPIFLLLGWEHVSVVANSNPFLRFQFDSYPISHGLVAVIGWATLYASVYFGVRSEEHTSELQSPYDLVCRLLLEKKNGARPWDFRRRVYHQRGT